MKFIDYANYFYILRSAEVFGPVAAAIEKLSESYETTTVTTPPGTTVT